MAQESLLIHHCAGFRNTSNEKCIVKSIRGHWRLQNEAEILKRYQSKTPFLRPIVDGIQEPADPPSIVLKHLDSVLINDFGDCRWKWAERVVHPLQDRDLVVLVFWFQSFPTGIKLVVTTPVDKAEDLGYGSAEREQGRSACRSLVLEHVPHCQKTIRLSACPKKPRAWPPGYA